jgi:hypothetical protein
MVMMASSGATACRSAVSARRSGARLEALWDYAERHRLGPKLGRRICGKYSGYEVFTGPDSCPEISPLRPRVAELHHFARGQGAHLENSAYNGTLEPPPDLRAVTSVDDDVKRDWPTLQVKGEGFATRIRHSESDCYAVAPADFGGQPDIYLH